MPTSSDLSMAAAGKKIYTEGIPSRGVAACMACHGEMAEGVGPIPRLASQHPSYIVKQLGYFQSNVRANETMHQMTEKLTPEEMADLAAYVGSL